MPDLAGWRTHLHGDRTRTLTTRRGRAAPLIRNALLLAALGCLAACAPDGAPEPDDNDATGVVFNDERRIDLTGNGVDERVTVHAGGPSYDSLRVRVAVRSAGDSLLYVDGWHSSLYFEHRVGASALPDTARQRIVRGHLTELLRDGAFAPPASIDGRPNPGGIAPDRDAVRWDIAERSWRSGAALNDTLPLPTGAHDAIAELVVSDSDVTALVQELARRPSFTYHAGGEVTYTVAWSDQERRFVRIRSCC
jgi:hypothetical protein